MIRRISMALLLAGTAGCATNLQKADRLFAQGQFAQARGFYQMELDRQRKSAELPRWTGREYQFQFSPEDTSKAILGVGNAYKEEGQPESALYQYSYFIQYSLRHGLDSDAEIAGIERWIKESGLAAPTTEVEMEKPSPSPKRAPARAAPPPAPKTAPPPEPPPAEVRPPPPPKAPAPAVQKKPSRTTAEEDQKPAPAKDEVENAQDTISW